jgi:hypothetical protein
MSQENKLSDGAKKSSIKEWAKKHKILSTIIIIFAIIIIGNALGGNKNNPSPQNNQANNQTDDQQTTTPAETKEKVWTSVFKTETNADKQTEGFNLQGGQQKIVYKNSGGQYSLCMVYIMKEGSTLEDNGGIPTVSINGDKTDETMMRKSNGEYYLDIKTANGT